MNSRYTAEIRIDRPLSMPAIRYHLEKQIRDRIGFSFDPAHYSVEFHHTGEVAIARISPISEFEEQVREIQFCIELLQGQELSDGGKAMALRGFLGAIAFGTSTNVKSRHPFD